MAEPLPKQEQLASIRLAIAILAVRYEVAKRKREANN